MPRELAARISFSRPGASDACEASFEATFSRTLAANVTVKALAEQADAGNLRQFNLSLFGPAAPMLIQRTYRMQHAGLGDFAVFISPVARTADGFEYQACFSHER